MGAASATPSTRDAQGFFSTIALPATGTTTVKYAVAETGLPHIGMNNTEITLLPRVPV